MKQVFVVRSTAVRMWVVCACCALVACSDSGADDINTWMAEQGATLKPRVTAIEAPKVFLPEPYAKASLPDPFDITKLTGGSPGSGGRADASSALLDAELQRRREPLEAFPLDSAKMVGVLKRGNSTVALIKIDALLYQLSVGAYLGQNYGKVVAIAENAVTLREIVQDGAGEWIERQTTLELQEGAQ
jgi:type IV pilus assembly protein PilP